MDYNKIIDEVLFGGGSTVSTHGQQVPSEGYVVSLGSKWAEVIPHRLVSNRAMFRDVLINFTVKFQRELSRHNHFVGAWDENDELYLDVVEVIPDRQQAITAGVERDQIAIWGLAQTELIKTGGSGRVG